jgi:signal transduction histidine kinase
VQAGAAEAVLESDPESARATVGSIRRTARESVTEMRRVLGLLRAGEADGREPQPTLDGLDGLVERFRASGVDVSLVVEGRRRTLAPGLELSAYRIVQEALTNVTRHAQAQRAEVRIDYGPRALTLEVRDDGRGLQPGTSPGHGLVGVRERVALLGGTFEAGSSPSGGYRLQAELPVGQEAP